MCRRYVLCMGRMITVSRKLAPVPAYVARDGSLYGFLVLEVDGMSKKINSLYELVKGKAYRLTVNYDGNKVGDVIIFSHLSTDKKGAPVGVFSPNGEPDMQSMFMAYLSEIENL